MVTIPNLENKKIAARKKEGAVEKQNRQKPDIAHRKAHRGDWSDRSC